ncbi:peptidylprolyl isomerase [Candidatus Woesearchaeota archaeon]|nr:peptidylprolyl isomerase [Candidatus Woesearchaeota archaeon]
MTEIVEKVKKGDFIEIDYDGKLPDGTIFDSTDAKKLDHEEHEGHEHGPAIICIGEHQVLAGLDHFLDGKDVGKHYSITLKPEEAFGKKDAKLIKLVPLDDFHRQKIEPQPGLTVSFDQEMGTVMRVSGGRVMVNFNHPLAGRDVTYEVKINKKIEDKTLQLQSYLKFAISLPGIESKVENDKAEITLPITFPPQMQEEFAKKLKEIIQVTDVSFKVKAPETKTEEEKSVKKSEKKSKEKAESVA